MEPVFNIGQTPRHDRCPAPTSPANKGDVFWNVRCDALPCGGHPSNGFIDGRGATFVQPSPSCGTNRNPLITFSWMTAAARSGRDDGADFA